MKITPKIKKAQIMESTSKLKITKKNNDNPEKEDVSKIKDQINPISDGVSDQRLLPGGSLGPRSLFRLILTSFWTCGTIDDQYLVKGVQ